MFEVTVSKVNNGFIVRVMDERGSKTFVVQAASDKPEEIEGVLDAISTAYKTFTEKG